MGVGGLKQLKALSSVWVILKGNTQTLAGWGPITFPERAKIVYARRQRHLVKAIKSTIRHNQSPNIKPESWETRQVILEGFLEEYANHGR